MTSNRNSMMMVKQSSTRRIDDEIGVVVGGDEQRSRVRNPSCSASSTLSSTSSSSSSSSSALSADKSHNHHNNSQSTDFIQVLVVYPNGFQTIKKLDARKAIYDILIELAATGKLLPSNYTLKLFASTTTSHHDESNFNDDKQAANDKLIEYTPNQTIGQLNPSQIKIIPKTSTLKHFQTETSNYYQFNTLSNHNSQPSLNRTVSTSNQSTPFELTNRVQVNLPFNQKTAVRVKLDISLEELLATICKEAALEKSRYELIVNGSRPNCDSDPLSKFNTKEVTLVLKNSETVYVKNSLNSRSSQSSSKSRTNSRSNLNRTTNQHTDSSSPLNRSKSEIDLSLNESTCSSSKEKKSASGQKSPSMFGFFTRKRRSKSKSSLCASHSNLALSCYESTGLSVVKCEPSEERNFGKYSTSYVSNTSLSKTKKRAPPPPPPNKMSLPNESGGISIVTIVNPGPKSDVIDDEMVEKIKQLTKKKQKKTAAPLPPQSLSPCSNSPNSNTSHDMNFSSPDHQTDSKTTTAKKLFLSMSESSSSPTTYPSPSLSDASSSASASNQDRVGNDGNEKSLHITKISNSLVMPVLKTASDVVEDAKDVVEAIVKRNSSIQSSSDSSEAELSKSPDRYFKYRNDCESVNDCSISSSNTSNLREDKLEAAEPSKLNESDLSLILANRNNFGRLKNTNGAVLDSKIATSSSEENSNTSVMSNEDPHHLQQSHSAIEIVSSETQINTNFEEPDANSSINSNLQLDTRIPNVFVNASEENSSYREHLRTDFEQELADLSSSSDHEDPMDEKNLSLSTSPKRRTAVIEVRPEYSRSSLIRISEVDVQPSIQKPLELRVNDSFNFENHDSEKEDNIAPLKTSQIPFNLRSPSSPLPQFPAIGENEINEMHGNYVVVRSGDIIEKNGIYYSSDGTIRGYSGTVKKMAGSKTLNEVFQKQQELEQIHEKEYQLELEKRRVSEANVKKDKENQIPPAQFSPPPPPPVPPIVTPTTNTSSVFNKRSSLGSIIANEKKSSPISNHTLSSNSNIFKSANTTPLKKYGTLIKPENNESIESELSRKLESRRQLIASQLNSQNENLHIDTKPTVKCSSLASSSNHSEDSSSPLSSPSVDSPPKNQFNNKSLTTPSFVMSAKFRTNYQPAKTTPSRQSITGEENYAPPPLPPSMFADPPQLPSPKPNIQTSKSSNLPPVAPKNFKHDTLVSINKKNQLLDARESLLESIKGFNVANLRKVAQTD